MNQSLIGSVTVLVILVASAIVHEVAHGLVAERLGDNTARVRGRITLNPIPHIDLMMTILLPLSLVLMGSPVIFGGAKPVPVDPLHFSSPRKGMGVVAIAGPISNFILAAACLAICYVLFFLNPSEEGILGLLGSLFSIGFLVNMVLGLFNLLPVPPLDGGRIAVALLPLSIARRWARLERVGLIIVALLLFSGMVGSVLGPALEFLLHLLPGSAIS